MEKNKFTSLKYGSLSILLVAIAVIIAVLVNLIALRFDIKWDLTPNKIYSLGDTTKDFIKKLNKEVTVYGLFDDGKIPSDANDSSSYQIYNKATEILAKYKGLSSKITVKYVDPDIDPAIMTQLDPEGTRAIAKGDFVFVCGKNTKKVTLADLQTSYQSQTDQQLTTTYLTAEFSFTSAIKTVAADKAPTVYFTEGHQEYKYDKYFTYVKKTLESAGFETKAVNLVSVEKVPADAEALFVLAPQKDIAATEQQKIYDYLNKGGKAMIMLDPIAPNTNLPQLEKLVSDYGITLNYDRVKETDETKHAPNKPYDIIISPEVNDINTRINEMSLQMLMPNSRSIGIMKTQKEGLTITPLLKTSDKAIGEQIDKSKGSDLVGPLTLAVAAEYQSVGSRLVVVGNAAFFSDQFVDQYEQSMYFFLSSSSWVLERKDDLAIPPKNMDSVKLEINNSSANMAAILLVLIIPILIFALGTVIWLRRRHL